MINWKNSYSEYLDFELTRDNLKYLRDSKGRNKGRNHLAAFVSIDVERWIDEDYSFVIYHRPIQEKYALERWHKWKVSDEETT